MPRREREGVRKAEAGAREDVCRYKQKWGGSEGGQEPPHHHHPAKKKCIIFPLFI